MRTRHYVIFALAAVVALAVPAYASAPEPPPLPPPGVTVTLLGPLPSHMTVGQEYSVDILVESDQPFVRAVAMSAPDYPAYFMQRGSAGAGHATSAVLHVTYLARKSTAELPDGVDPVDLYVAVRIGGERYVQPYHFEVDIE